MKTRMLTGGPHPAEELKLPVMFADLPKPPQMGTIEIFLDEEDTPTHPTFLWSAKIGRQTFHVYRPECRGGKSGYRIDSNNKEKMTFPNQSQFELALYCATDKALDKY